jgi:ABC transporter with metal-binding/Fe-S-binding domain ATP-binding protein
MDLAALFSGGKDSTYAVYLAKKEGHVIKYLVTIMAENPESYMYHTVNIGLTMLISRVMGIQLGLKKSAGKKEAEVKDLEISLKNLDVEGVVVGAIASEYQRSRVEKVCKELNLKMLAPLWSKDQIQLLRDMVKDGFKIIITSVSAEGFDESWLGREIDENCIEDLIELNKKYKINVAGEGGEFETFVIDCPLYSKKIEITDSKKKWEGNSGVLIIKDAKLLER